MTDDLSTPSAEELREALRNRVDVLTAENTRLHETVEGLDGRIRGIVKQHAQDVSENARLRAEAKKWCDACGCADGASMELRADLARVTAELSQASFDHVHDLDVLHAHAAALGADLARVTGERDGLREAHNPLVDRIMALEPALVRCIRERDALLDAAKMWLGDCGPALGAHDALRAAVSACAPPASGEEPSR